MASLLKAVGLVKVLPDGKVDHNAGADFVEDIGFRGGYDPKAALSALAAFPWPYSCVQAISTDLSKVPIRVYRGRGANAELLDTHPILELMDRPSSRVSGVLFRRQLYTDMVLTGNAFILLAGSGGRIDALLRLHPSRVQIAPLSDGQPDKYQYAGGDGQPYFYEHEQVLHVRSPSWSDDPTSLWGTGAVQPLHKDLTTEMAQADLASRVAATGQPTGILSPKEEGDRWSREQIKTLRSAYESQMRSGGSGVLILGGQASFEKLQVTPREMEFSQVRDFVRASTIAAFGCVPVRLGLETANYSQSRNQLQLYWESLQGRAALVDSELTRLARMFDDDVTVRHDFSEIESLQESRAERLNRVIDWQMLGVPVDDAAAYEGFDDLPVPDQPEPIQDTEDADEPTAEAPDGPATGEPLAATALNGAQIASLMQILSSVAMGAISFDAALVLIGVAFPTIDEESARKILAGAQAVDDDDAVQEQIERLVEDAKKKSIDEQRLVAWKQWQQNVQGPAERAIQLAMLRYLRGLAARISRRLPNVVPKKAVNGNIVVRADDDWADDLIDALEERKIADKAMRDSIGEAWRRGVQAALDEMPGHVSEAGQFDFDRVDQEVDDQLAEMLGVRPDGQGGFIVTDGGITATTRADVRKLIVDSIAAGETITDMQANLMKNHAFSPSRARMIARTEATRSVNAASVNAWEQMTDNAGLEVEFTWFAQPGARDSHAALHGEKRNDEGYFEVNGSKAKHPGGFGVAGLDINCRCRTLPEVNDD